jgi:hypothetical protein
MLKNLKTKIWNQRSRLVDKNMDEYFNVNTTEVSSYHTFYHPHCEPVVLQQG